MSSGIAPVPTANAALVGDRQPHREQTPEPAADDNADAGAEAASAPESANVVQFRPEPPANNAAATFAASQLAERLKLVEANLRLLRLKTEGWKPPASELSLRDKTI